MCLHVKMQTLDQHVIFTYLHILMLKVGEPVSENVIGKKRDEISKKISGKYFEFDPC